MLFKFLFISMRIIQFNQHLFDIFMQPNYNMKLTESSETLISSYISIPKVHTQIRTESQWSCETKIISPNIASLISSCKLVKTCFLRINIIKCRTKSMVLYNCKFYYSSNHLYCRFRNRQRIQ